MLLLPTIGLAALLLVSGCCDDCDDPAAVDLAPAAPTGLVSITGDELVELYWNANTEPDLAGYDIFWAEYVDGEVPIDDDFDYMVSVGRHETYYFDEDVANGTTYFYKIAAYDYAGNVSELSDFAFDTPRPAGEGLVIYDYLGQNSGKSGYDFSKYTVQASGINTTDVYFGSPNGIPTLFGKGPVVGDGVDVQDYGNVQLVLVDWAPEIYDGWASSKRVELTPGHSYVVQMLDEETRVGDDVYYRYAKVYVHAVTNDFVVLDWAFQEDPGNPELAPGIGGAR